VTLELHDRLRSAYLWTFAGTVLRQLLSFGLSVLLARFLAPSDYGLAGIVSIFIAILSAMQEAGIGQAVIYFGDEADLPTLCTVSTGVGLLSCALLNLAAQPIAVLYHSNQLTPVIRWMSLALVLGGLKSVSQAVVTRKLYFRKITAIESAGGLLALGVAVLMAWRGYGIWSIVVNGLLSVAFSTVMMLIAVPPRFTLHAKRELIYKVVRWGLPLTGSSLLWNFYDNADDMIVGRMSTAQQLGFYTFAFRMATLVNERITAVMGRVSFPAFAALKQSGGELTQHWLSITNKTALLTFPALAILAFASHDFVLVTLGPKWLPTVPVLRLLCVAAALRGLTPIVINLLPALGKPGLAFRYVLVNSIVMPTSFIIGCNLAGIKGVALAWLICFPLLAGHLIKTGLSLTNVSWRTYLANLKGPVLSAFAVSAVMTPVLAFAVSGLMRLSLTVLAGGLVFAACLYFGLDIKNKLALLRRKLPSSRIIAISVVS
jgi:O-antigen/teichoic acid export membrane protein